MHNKTVIVLDANGNAIQRISLERSVAIVEKLKDITDALGLVVDEMA